MLVYLFITCFQCSKCLTNTVRSWYDGFCIHSDLVHCVRYQLGDVHFCPIGLYHSADVHPWLTCCYHTRITTDDTIPSLHWGGIPLDLYYLRRQSCYSKISWWRRGSCVEYNKIMMNIGKERTFKSQLSKIHSIITSVSKASN